MDPFDEHVILRYLTGEAAPEEIRHLEAWIQKSEANRRYFIRITDLYHSGEIFSGGKTVSKSMERKNRRVNRLRGVWRVAAAMVITAGLSWGGLTLLQEKTGRKTSQVIRVPAGSMATVVLPDSTKIWLNAESSLTYNPGVFGKRSRDVFLTGEAYFDVTHQGKKQFTVHTGKIDIKVFGTRFNVKAYPEDATVETTLEEGRIVLEKVSGDKPARGSRPVVLHPLQRAVLVKNEGRLLLSDVVPPSTGGAEDVRKISVKSGKILVADHVDTKVYTSWKEGRLIIRGEPLEHLAKKLERRYDVKIIFRDNEAGALRFTGILENETLEQVLFAIHLSSPIRYTIDHKTVYLEKIK